MLDPLVALGAEVAATIGGGLPHARGTPPPRPADRRHGGRSARPGRYVAARRAGAAMTQADLVAYASAQVKQLAGGTGEEEVIEPPTIDRAARAVQDAQPLPRAGATGWRRPPQPSRSRRPSARRRCASSTARATPCGSRSRSCSCAPAHHPRLRRPVGPAGRCPGLRRLPAPGQLVHVLHLVVQDHRRLDRARAQPRPDPRARGCPGGWPTAARSCCVGSSPVTTAPPTGPWRRATATCSSRSAWRSPCSWRPSTPGAHRSRRGGVDRLLAPLRRAGRAGPARPELVADRDPPRRRARAGPAPVLRGAVHAGPRERAELVLAGNLLIGAYERAGSTATWPPLALLTGPAMRRFGVPPLRPGLAVARWPRRPTPG